LTRDHSEQRRLTGAVRADHADDAAWRKLERKVLDEKPVAVTLREVLDLQDDAAESRTRWDLDLSVADLLAARLLGQFLIGLDTRLGLGLPRLRARPDPLQLALEGALLGLFLVLLDLEALGLLLEPARVIALVGDALA